MTILRTTTWMALLATVSLAAACGGSAFVGNSPDGGAGTGGAGGAQGGSGGVAGSGGGVAGSGGAEPDWHACAKPGECVFVAKGCCSACEINNDTVDTVNRQVVPQAKDFYCPGDPPPCQACPPGSQYGKADFIPACRGNVCQLEDITQSPLSACKNSSDCELVSAGCCGSCAPAPWDIIALAKKHVQDYQAQVCNPLSGMECPQCVPTFPSEYGVHCTQGHCQVVMSGGAGGGQPGGGSE